MVLSGRRIERLLSRGADVKGVKTKVKEVKTEVKRVKGDVNDVSQRPEPRTDVDH